MHTFKRIFVSFNILLAVLWVLLRQHQGVKSSSAKRFDPYNLRNNKMNEEYRWIVGYGSLMSEDSAQQTVQTKNFGPAILRGWRRHFNLVSITNIRKGFASLETNEIAAVSARPGYPESKMLVSLFQIPANEEAAYRQREGRYQYTNVTVNIINPATLQNGNIRNMDRLLEINPNSQTVEALMCYEYNDKDFRTSRFTSEEEYNEKIGQYYDGLLWRKDIYPVRRYLQLCLNAAKSLGGSFGVDNFMHTSYLANEVTSIHSYLQDNADIMGDHTNLENT